MKALLPLYTAEALQHGLFFVRPLPYWIPNLIEMPTFKRHLPLSRSLLCLLFMLSLVGYAKQSLAADISLVVGTTDSGEYGWRWGSSNNRDVVTASFADTGSDLTLSATGYDVDTNQEVAVRLNGDIIGHLSRGTNNGLNDGDTFTITADQQLASNTITFEQTIVSGYIWGVTGVGLQELAAITPDITLAPGTTDTTEYGWRWGTNNHRDIITASFADTGADITLLATGYDIDTSKEVIVKLNGDTLGFLSRGTNNGLNAGDAFTITAEQQLPQNEITFEQNIVSGYIWGVTDVGLQEQVAAPDLTLTPGNTNSTEFGWQWGSNDHRDVVTAAFANTGGDIVLTATGYDVDSNQEVIVKLNGDVIGYLSKGGNNSLTGGDSFTITADQQLADNIVTFEQNLISGYIWGVTNIGLEEQAVSPVIELSLGVTDTTEYGWRWGTNNHRDVVTTTFSGIDEDIYLSVTGYDVDQNDEVVVKLNGNVIGYLSVGPSNNSLNTGDRFLIPAANLLSDNTITFEQNRVSGFIWGVKDITIFKPVPDLSTYRLVFEEEFTGSALDPDVWKTGLLWGPYLPINNEKQLYVDTLGMHDGFSHNPFTFTGESLIITASPTSNALQPPPRPDENDVIWDNYNEYRYNGPVTIQNEDGSTTTQPGYQESDVEYLSGIITSYDSFKMTHGYVEARAKVPAGRGLWPAFWMLTSHYIEDVPEIDVMEFLGQDVDIMYQTYHYFDIQDNWRKISSPSFVTNHADWTQDFHTFGMSWSPEEIVWYIDGIETHRISDDDYTIAAQAMYLLANLAVGGDWPGDPDDPSDFPAEFEIDYIRAYKKIVEPLNLADDYKLVFNDEFNGAALDTEKWNTTYLWGPYFNINNEKQYYIDANDTDSDLPYSPFSINNGVLSITADLASNMPAGVPPASLPASGDPIWSAHPEFQQGPYPFPGSTTTPEYTSGVITSYDTFKFTHGYAEIRAKAPAVDGLWPAFWLLNAYYIGDIPEIDILEGLGETPNLIYHTYHYYNSEGQLVSNQFTSNVDSSEFHTYGVHWQHGKIVWYLDGVPVHTFEDEKVSYQLMYVIANLAVEGNFNSAPVDDSKLPASFDIDYIRVYQENLPD